MSSSEKGNTTVANTIVASAEEKPRDIAPYLKAACLFLPPQKRKKASKKDDQRRK